MNEARGTVIELDGEYAWVRIDAAGCGHCHEAGGCGGQRLEKIFCDTPARYRVRNPALAQPGECVTVTMPSGALGRSAMQAYGPLLLGLFAGAFGGLALAGETGAMVGSGLGVLAGWLILRHFRPTEADAKLQPYVNKR